MSRLSFSRIALVLMLLGRVASAEESALGWPRTIEAVEIHGLWRTDGQVVLRELPWKVQESVTEESWELGLRRLWNLGVFGHVGAHTEVRDGRTVAIFDLEERWTTNPLFRFGFGGSTGWIRAGLWDINTFGRYIESGGLYERFGNQNGGMAWIRNPRLFDLRFDEQLSAYRLSRSRLVFTTVRTGVRLDLVRELGDEFHFGGWLEGTVDAFLGGPVGDLRPPLTQSLQLGGIVRFGIVNTIRLRQQGWSVELRPALGLTDRSPPFGSLVTEALWFRMVGDLWNFGVRLQGGAMTAALPQFHFFLSPLDHVRGFRDNFVETDRYAFANAEARFIALDWGWIALMPAAFIDVAVAQPLEGSTTGVVSGGVGVRFLLPRIYRSGLRVDAAWPLAPFATRPSVNILSVGVYQYF